MQDGFTSRDVIALTGIKARQLQRSDQRGAVIPERERHRRRYTTRHLSEVAVLCESRRKGFSLQGLLMGIRFLDSAKAWSKSSTEYHLSTDGTHLYLESWAREIVDILKNSDQPIPGICLTDAVGQIRPGLPQKRRILR